MGRLADWLTPLPPPSPAELARWETGLRVCIGIFVFNEIAVFYFLVLADIEQLPRFWVAYTEWIARFVPAAEGHVNRSYYFKAETPSVFAMTLTCSTLVALVMGWTHDKRNLVNAFVNFPRLGFLRRYALTLPVYFILWWLLVHSFLTLQHEPVHELRLYHGAGDMIHSRFGMISIYVPTFYVLGYWIGFHLAGLRHIAMYASGRLPPQDSGPED